MHFGTFSFQQAPNVFCGPLGTEPLHAPSTLSSGVPRVSTTSFGIFHIGLEAKVTPNSYLVKSVCAVYGHVVGNSIAKVDRTFAAQTSEPSGPRRPSSCTRQPRGHSVETALLSHSTGVCTALTVSPREP